MCSAEETDNLAWVKWTILPYTAEEIFEILRRRLDKGKPMLVKVYECCEESGLHKGQVFYLTPEEYQVVIFSLTDQEESEEYSDLLLEINASSLLQLITEKEFENRGISQGKGSDDDEQLQRLFKGVFPSHVSLKTAPTLKRLPNDIAELWSGNTITIEGTEGKQYAWGHSITSGILHDGATLFSERQPGLFLIASDDENESSPTCGWWTSLMDSLAEAANVKTNATNHDIGLSDQVCIHEHDDCMYRKECINSSFGSIIDIKEEQYRTASSPEAPDLLVPAHDSSIIYECDTKTSSQIDKISSNVCANKPRHVVKGSNLQTKHKSKDKSTKTTHEKSQGNKPRRTPLTQITNFISSALRKNNVPKYKILAPSYPVETIEMTKYEPKKMPRNGSGSENRLIRQGVTTAHKEEPFSGYVVADDPLKKDSNVCHQSDAVLSCILNHRHLGDYTVGDVCDLLTNLGMETYADTFAHELIDGQTLIDLDELGDKKQVLTKYLNMDPTDAAKLDMYLAILGNESFV